MSRQSISRSVRGVSVAFDRCRRPSDIELPRPTRIVEFYAVCDQAQIGALAREARRFLKHLLHQEDLRLKAGGASRFECGARRDVQQFANVGRELSFSYRVVIVQPGLSKAKIAPAFLNVLGVIETFL